ncbi:hypothetical protein [Deinococcus soli (ex Cha et al. 2016)]|uniref:hypothetical protein n=1 Tax=Deinococcus soli (ex Cha et al. 2016) TaxID=1309411 RepID=UPI00166D6D59|nr:hypothetical protein [Deinococcus soli (ex Cha et al. 2016)]GGB69506.1 hypothetical protein GCM10008019_27120 [Deinococcus soli (ex Cha et al. 2016)]
MFAQLAEEITARRSAAAAAQLTTDDLLGLLAVFGVPSEEARADLRAFAQACTYRPPLSVRLLIAPRVSA